MRALRIMVAILAPWILLEIGLRVFGWVPPDLRPRATLFPSFPPFYEPDRELGWKLKPNLDWQGPELVTPFHTDKHGNRRNPFLEAEDLPSTVDAIGDSSTFGYGVSDAETYPATLQRVLNQNRKGGSPVVVRNLGVPGYTSLEARLLAEREGHHAPVTLIMVGFNDHFGTLRPRIPSLWMRRASYACFRSLACSLLFDWATWRDPKLPVERIGPQTYVPDVPERRYVAELTRAVRSLRARHSEPILLVYPSLVVDDVVIEQIAEHFRHPTKVVRANVDAHPKYQDLTRQVARTERTALVELPRIFERADNASLHLDWVHPNRTGHALIAWALDGPVRETLTLMGVTIADPATATAAEPSPRGAPPEASPLAARAP